MEPNASGRGTLWRLHRLLRSNWVTSIGAALMTLAVFVFATVALLHWIGGPWSGPYVGIIATAVTPLVFVVGLVMVPLGLVLFRKSLHTRLAAIGDRPLYLARAVVVLTAINFAAIGSVGHAGVHYMSSTEFCGKACHTVMEPEYVTFQRSPHQRVDCVKCHVEPGAQGFIESKLNGTKQLIGVIRDNYHRPIPTPIHGLADARLTCEQCHWPEKYLGTKMKVKPHFRTDEKVSSFTNVLLMRTGGKRADGAVVGIHWHVHPDASVEYVAADERRTKIPWLRIVKPDGTKEVFAAPGTAHDPPPAGELRRMDCNDCHNRAAHAFELPGDALDTAFAAGMLPRDLPFLKKEAMAALEGDWTRENAAAGIRDRMLAAYPKEANNDAARVRLDAVSGELTKIWMRNVWPERKLGWNAYPDLATHVGCFRCHDGQHESPQGRVVFGPTSIEGAAPIRDGSCDKCHVVLSENEESPAVLDTFGLKR
jgi:hypothetical protein